MSTPTEDVRFGHDLSQVQDESGVDLLQLKKQLELSVEERFVNLEKQLGSCASFKARLFDEHQASAAGPKHVAGNDW